MGLGGVGGAGGAGGVGGVGADTCSKVGPCKCQFEDESVVDLSDLDTKPAYIYSANTFDANDNGSSWTLNTYFFHPCRDVAMGDQKSIPNECAAASVCRHSIEFRLDNNNTYIKKDLGNSLIGQISGSELSGNDNKLSIVYKKYNAVQASIILSCIKDKNSDSTLQVIKSDPSSIVLNFFSPKACAERVAEPCHHSLGTTLLIIFFVLVLVYLITGCCVKHFMMGARGIEIIPNYNFWKELPSLVKDGLAFVQNGFKPPPQPSTSPGSNPNPNPNSYDSI